MKTVASEPSDRRSESKIVATEPFDDQKPGTSGLRKRVSRFREPNYLENFVQSLFDRIDVPENGLLVLGGDGRFHNDRAIQTIVRMAAANGVSRVMVGRGGIFSTPAVSHAIRLHGAFGGIILSASHNPGGPQGDFGIKYNGGNGGPAPEAVTNAVFARSRQIAEYRITETDDVDLSELGATRVGAMAVEVVDPVADYAALMETLFDFDAIRALIAGGFRFRFDAMHAVTGPYARRIFGEMLGVADDQLMNCEPLPDFGGGHPDPNRVHARHLFEATHGSGAEVDLACASDGDGDRNLVVGRDRFVAPSDSLAVLAANLHHCRGYPDGLVGAARSMPTSAAVDRVAQARGVECFETPTGWKFFGNLLDAGRINICGEESAGTGSDHVREKDGLWAVLAWLNVLAARKESVADILADHWATYGRDYYLRHDYEDVDADAAAKVMEHLRSRLSDVSGETMEAGQLTRADEFAYDDPIDGSRSEGQGLRFLYEDGSRFVFRLSGTGTVGATIRLYLERYVGPDGALDLDVDEALAPLARDARTLSRLGELTGRDEPDVVT